MKCLAWIYVSTFDRRAQGANLGQRVRVLERRDVSGLFVAVALPDQSAHDLAGARFGKLADDMNFARAEGPAQTVGDRVGDRLQNHLWIAVESRPCNEDQDELLALDRIGDSDGGRLAYVFEFKRDTLH